MQFRNFTFALAFALCATMGLAENTTDTVGAKDSATTGSAKAAKDIGNKNCPVTGQPVGSMEKGAHVVYNGQKIGLCCSGCEGKFRKDPEKYVKAAKEDAATAKQ